MNSFLILSLLFILGLLFCSVLGGYCGFTEGFQNGKSSENQPQKPSTATGDISVSSITGVSSTGGKENKVYNKSTFDNYNHFTGDSHPTKFYGPNGESATVVNTNGTFTLLIVDSNGINHIYITDKNTTTSSSPASSSPASSSPASSSPASSSPASSSPSSSFTENIYYGSNGGKAVVTSDNTGNYAILVTQPDKTVVMYTTTNVPNMSSSMPTANSAFPSSSPSSSMPPAMMPSSSMPSSSMPSSSMPSSSAPPYNYGQSLPSGIPSSMIPQGQEDLYILKSQVVPPVCPACPTVNACPTENSKDKCPPCKPCGRCPEPSFECKKTYNYNSSGSGANNLPMPILNDFSTFGM